MNTHNRSNRFLEVDGESQKLDSHSRIVHLVAGLERQKDELGAIAFELIDLLHRLGAGDIPQPLSPHPPQANGKT